MAMESCLMVPFVGGIKVPVVEISVKLENTGGEVVCFAYKNPTTVVLPLRVNMMFAAGSISAAS